MPIYKQTTEITNIDDLLSSVERDIEEVYFGDKEVFTVWATYDGTLPAQYSANGSALADYRIYGAAGGVGDRTENLAWTGWAEDAVSRGIGTISTVDGRSIFSFSAAIGYPNYDNNKWIFSTNWATNTQYTISFDYQRTSDQSTSMIMQVRYTDDTHEGFGNCVNDGNWNSYVFTTAANKTVKNICAFYTSGWLNIDIDTFMVNEGSTVPASYVPYGYEVDMSVSDGTTSTTTQIYIGDTPLGKDEYVSFKEQKVYRRTENLFHGDFINGSLTAEGYLPSNTRIVSENYIKIDELQNTISITPQIENLQTIIFYYDSNKGYLGNSADFNTGWQSLSFTFSAPNNTKYVRIVFRYSNNSLISPNVVSNVMLNTGATAKTYTPYYQPTDPPVSLPALPTVDGTNIVDYAGQSAAVPSRFTAKYRKQNF